MWKPYQLVMLSIALLLPCLLLEAGSYPRNLNSRFPRRNATFVKPANNYPGPGYNSTGASYGRFNTTRFEQPVQSIPLYGDPYQNVVLQPNFGFHSNSIVSGTPYQYNGSYGHNASRYVNGSSYGNYNYGKPSNNTTLFGRLFRFW